MNCIWSVAVPIDCFQGLQLLENNLKEFQACASNLSLSCHKAIVKSGLYLGRWVESNELDSLVAA